MTPQEFFQALFTDIDHGALALWVKDKTGSQSLWYDPGDFGGMALDALQYAKTHDVYFNVCPQKKKLGVKRRGKASEVSAVSTLWADIDCSKKAGYFPTIDDARKFLDQLPLKYSFLIQSGSGLHAYWLLDEVFEIESDDDRKRIATASAGWQGFMRKLAAEQGHTIDSTADLARVLRVPGTMNHKHSQEVLVLESTGCCHALGEIENYLVTNGDVMVPSAAPSGLIINENMSPNFDLMQATLVNDQQFKATWDRSRKDLADQSPSGYCMSLANICVRLGWPEAEIVKLLIAFQRKEPDANVKATRPEWYGMTINKAKKSIKHADALQHISIIDEDEIDTGDDEEKQKLLNEISTILGIEITKVIKIYQESIIDRVKEPPQYEIETAAGILALSNVDDFMIQHRLRRRIVEDFDILISTQKKQVWEKVVRLLLSVAEHQVINSDDSEIGLIRKVVGYVVNETSLTDDIQEAKEQDICYQDQNGDIFFSWDKVFKMLRLKYGYRQGNKKLSRVLELLGYDRVKFDNIKSRSGNQTSYHMWRWVDEE